MKGLAAVMVILALVSVAGAFEIMLEGYDGGNVTVRLISLENQNVSKEFTVQNSTLLIDNLENGTYHVIVDYKDLRYTANIVIPETESLTVNFEKTDDVSVIEADNIHYILNYDNSNGFFVVMEVLNLRNTGNKYFSGNFTKKLPEGVDHLFVDQQTLAQSGVYFENVTQGEDYIEIENLTVQPNGTFTLAFMYFTGADPVLIVDHPAKVLRVISPEFIKVQLPENFVQENTITNSEGVVYRVYRTDNVSSGSVFQLQAEVDQTQVSPTGTAQPGNSDSSGVNTTLLAGVALIGAGVAILAYSRFSKKGEEGEEEEEDTGGWEIKE
ncbi:hypothetical protein [Geoglobus acetivorans]|uniref:Uncharacterized protein n=1 Tax=Geoglobus acetivorans TaxID=565033 RepID=A0A0A7GC97_GEOAI|nr:hypothetical protein GACE_0400 [Geoglobus acetivorans]